VLKAPLAVLECISEGYRLPLLSISPQYARGNQRSALLNDSFVLSAITDLLANRCVQRVSYKRHICSPLSVVANSAGKLRLVVNLRYFNQFLLKDRFKSMMTLGLQCKQETICLHLTSNPDTTMWTSISNTGNTWGSPGELGPHSIIMFFASCHLAEPQPVFCSQNCCGPLKYWRGHGQKIVVYLVDSICALGSRASAEQDSLEIQNDLTRAGFVTNVRS